MSGGLNFVEVLSRLTAQSKDQDPKRVKGGLPTLTTEDIQALASQAGLGCPDGKAIYWALVAKYCQYEVAETQLTSYLKSLSWKTLGNAERLATFSITPRLHQKMVEAAISVFLNPYTRKGVAKSDQWISDQMGVHRSTFVRKYKSYFRLLMNKLEKWESRGINDVLAAHRGRSS